MQIESESNKKSAYYELLLSDFKTLVIMGGLSDEIIERVLKFDYDQLKIDFGDWRDLSFLHGHEDKIKKLHIGSENCDWGVINNFFNIDYLSIGGWFKTELKFSGFKYLKYLSTYHNDGYGDDLYNLPSLKVLKITGWKGKNCGKLASLTSLESLTLIDSYSLQSLDGIEELKRTREIELHGLRKLQNIESIAKLQCLNKLVISGCGSLEYLHGLAQSQSLCELYIEGCRKLIDFSFLKGAISNTLHELFMNDLELDSLNPLKDLHKLETLSLVSSKVKDGDLSILFKLEALNEVWLKNNRNFKPNAKEVNAYFEHKKMR